jgi:micrococcal nuclease
LESHESDFDADIAIVGSGDAPIRARVTVSHGVLTIVASGGEIGSSPVTDIPVARTGDAFVLGLEGEQLRITPDRPDAFGDALGRLSPAASTGGAPDHPASPAKGPPVADGPGDWWRFWSGSAWRGWLATRSAWRSYRQAVDPLDRRIRRLQRSINDEGKHLDVAHRDLLWARELSPIDAPVNLRRGETALKAILGVTLLETRRKDGRKEWTPIDRGTLYATDRRLVFSGRKDVRFDFDELVRSSRTRHGLHLEVSSRKQDHTLDGPVEQMVVVLAAAQAAGEGRAPWEPFEDRVLASRAQLAADQESLDVAKTERGSIPAVTRPVSPAWLPVGAVALLAAVGMSLPSPGDETVVASGAGDGTVTEEPAPEDLSPATTLTTAAAGTTSTSLSQVRIVAAVAMVPLEAGPSGDPGANPPTGAEQVEIVSITDGDTLDVRLTDGSVDAVRLIGINSPEGGECLSDVATDVLGLLVPLGGIAHVTLDASDRDQFGRLLRYLWVGSASVNEELVRRGVAISRRYPPDTALAERFEAAQTAARISEAGIWAPDACGSVAEATIRVVGLNYDPPGNDNDVLNEEWIRLRNHGDTAVDLTGWTIRDESASHRYEFPSGFTLAADETVTIRTGCGTDFSTELYWCNQGSAIWNNDGDTAFIVDPNGNIHTDYSYSPPVTTTPATTTTTTTTAQSVTTTAANCHPSYPTVCIPPPPPDLNCGDIPYRRFQVTGSDPHGFDGDNDGIGCES